MDGAGTTIAFGTSNFSGSWESLSVGGVTRNAIDQTHLGSTQPSGDDQYGGMEFTPAKHHDPGTITGTLIYEPTDHPPLNGPAETITITLPAENGYSSGDIYSGSGFITDWGLEIPRGDKVTMPVTIKKTGVWTHTNAVAS